MCVEKPGQTEQSFHPLYFISFQQTPLVHFKSRLRQKRVLPKGKTQGSKWSIQSGVVRIAQYMGSIWGTLQARTQQ